MAWLYQPILQATAALGNHSPSVALNTPLDTGSVGPTPTLDFTGTDADTDDIRYRVQIHTDAGFGIVTDNFDRANSANLGSNWSLGPESIAHSNVGPQILSNRAYNEGTSDCDAFYSGASFSADQFVQATVKSINSGTDDFSGILVRADASDYVMVQVNKFGGNYRMYWYNGGTYTLLGDYSATPAVNDVLRLEAVGTTFYFYLNGVLRITGSDAGVPSTGSPGIILSGSNADQSSLDDWSAGNATVLIDAISGTDLGFANPDNGGDTDPFTSGENIQYTVQAGDTLADGTYYWRVIAIDPSGSNVYGNWSEIRSFVVTSATSYTITKSLKYTVVKAITAITKSLKYTVKTTPATVTKTLRYFVNKAGTITKSLKYSVVKAITLTKSLKYTVFTNPTALTKSLKYSVLKSLTITKALIYKVQRSASAITKSLKYTVLKSLTVTKSLKYTIVKSATAITKSLKYSVIKATTITKSLTYEVVSATSTTITKSLTYAILKSYSITKSLTYLVRSPATITKSLKYAVIKAITLTKSLKYAVTKPGTITKQLIYKVLTSTTLTKSLSYMVTAGQTIQKSLKYAVVKATTLTKSLTYYVVNNGVIQRTLRYHVISQHTIDLDLSYRIITSGVITKSLRYVVSVPRGYRSALPSSRQTRPLDQVSGQAVDSTNKSTQLQTYQAKTIL